jgi:hypothetical protein
MGTIMGRRWTVFAMAPVVGVLLGVLVARLEAARADRRPNPAPQAPGAVGAPAGQAWEYKIVSQAITDYDPDSAAWEAELNRLGSEGWELCTTAVGGRSPTATWVFKRALRTANGPADRL